MGPRRAIAAGAAAIVIGAAVVALVARAAKAPQLHRAIVYRAPGMDRVQVRRDQVYRQVGGQSLWLNVYRPSGPAPPGGWSSC